MGIRFFAFVASLVTLSSASRQDEWDMALARQQSGRVAARAEEGYFAGADGVRLFYRKVGTGSRMLVYVHGGPGSNFRGNGTDMEQLAKGRTVLMYDQRGSGLSEIVTEASQLTARHHVRDLEALRKRFSADRMSLIGLSWGAALAALYADEYSERVERLILISPMSPTMTLMRERIDVMNGLLGTAAVKRRDAIRSRMPTADERETGSLCRELTDMIFRQYFHPATSRKLKHAATRCEIPAAAIRNRAVVEAATMASLGEWDFRPMLARLRVPALVLEGEKSKVPLRATRIWAECIPNSRLVLIPNAGHECFVDQPKSFRDLVYAFLSE